LKSGFGVLTGGPGRGKTFMIEMLATAANEAKLNTLLLAPTGKAARVMLRATNAIAPCMTAQKAVVEDRMIRAGRIQPGGPTKSRLQMADIIIIDESSMVDQILAYEVLMAASKPNVRIYFVGDVDQLQSVGPGRVLRDVIAVEDVPVVRLTKNFRTGAGSTIPVFAEAVNSGVMPPKDLADCRYVPEEALVNKSIATGTSIADLCASFARSQFEKNGEYPLFLVAQYKSDLGIHALNEAMRSITNPPSDDKAETSDGKFRIGDAVMCTANDYTLNVFNGETGKIEEVDYIDDVDSEGVFIGDVVRVRMDEGKELISLTKRNMASWVFAWAISIHKSQGSQADHVCLVLSQSHQFMLNKEMLYTGATRAKTKLTIIGDDFVIERSVKKKSDDHRITFLSDRINQALETMKKKDGDDASVAPGWMQ
jgi:exodeoxyribonuclease V alpha subunit